MRLAAYTIGGIDRASSRLRSFYLFSQAEGVGLEVSRPHRYCEALNHDVVHIQKKLTYELILWILIYRVCRLKIIFDIDDQPTCAKAFFGYLLVLSLANVVTVDTEARKKYWLKYLLLKNVYVVHDIADTNAVEPNIKKRCISGSRPSFFWIGYSCNLPSLNSFIEHVRCSTFKLTVSVEVDAIKSLEAKYPFLEFIPWSDGVAFKESIEAKFMVLNHNYDSASRMKSENKMVLAILAGFVPIVSRTPAYTRLAKSLNVEFLLFDDLDEIPKIVSVIGAKDFSSFFIEANNFIKSNYSRSAVLSDFNKKILLR